MRIITSIMVYLLFLAFSAHVAGVIGTGKLFGLTYKGHEISAYALLSIAGATFFGAILGSIYEHLENSSENEAWWTSIGAALRTKRFGMSLLATPLIVFIVFDQVYSRDIDIGLGLFCLQSGFFWNRIISLIKPKQTAPQSNQ